MTSTRRSSWAIGSRSWIWGAGWHSTHRPGSSLRDRPLPSSPVSRVPTAASSASRCSVSGTCPLTGRPPPVGGEAAGEPRRRPLSDPFPYLLLLDERESPIGWVGEQEIPAGGTLSRDVAVPMSPFLEAETTLKDALSMLLASEVQAGLVGDRDERLVGMITVDQIASTLRST